MFYIYVHISYVHIYFLNLVVVVSNTFFFRFEQEFSGKLKNKPRYPGKLKNTGKQKPLVGLLVLVVPVTIDFQMTNVEKDHTAIFMGSAYNIMIRNQELKDIFNLR